jgi:hypothetical protein
VISQQWSSTCTVGKGFENINRLGGFSTATRIFLGMENIHVVAKAYRDLKAVCCSSSSSSSHQHHNSSKRSPHGALGYDWLLHISEVGGPSFVLCMM